VKLSARHALALLAVAGLLALAGCGGSTKTVFVGGTPTGVGTAKTVAEPTGPVVHLSAFRSPTGNIGCALSGEQARCDIGRRNWPAPTRPARCPAAVDFGQGVELGATGRSRFVCAGDTVRDPGSPVLPYGSTSVAGPFECISASNGMTCIRPADGHGFFLSIQTYRQFGR
jgi:hypothetical protein